jgi:hypothetical protein
LEARGKKCLRGRSTPKEGNCKGLLFMTMQLQVAGPASTKIAYAKKKGRLPAEDGLFSFE